MTIKLPELWLQYAGDVDSLLRPFVKKRIVSNSTQKTH